MAGQQTKAKTTKRNIKPQVPGQAPTPEQQPPQEVEEDSVIAIAEAVEEDYLEDIDLDEGSGGNDEDTITVSKSELEALIDSRVDSAAAQAVHNYRREQQSAKPAKVKLPPQDSFDPQTLTRSRLSDEGWVVPVAFPDDKKRAKLD